MLMKTTIDSVPPLKCFSNIGTLNTPRINRPENTTIMTPTLGYRPSFDALPSALAREARRALEFRVNGRGREAAESIVQCTGVKLSAEADRER